VDGGLIEAVANEISQGRAGRVGLEVGSFVLTDGAQISVATRGLGPAGQVTVRATEGITLVGSSGISTVTTKAGTGGDINLRARWLELRESAKVSASSTGLASAVAGNVKVIFAETLSMDSSSIATESSLADGGNIEVRSTGSILKLFNSQITTSVKSGSGTGGNITLGSPQHPLSFVVLNNSTVVAKAFGGRGGNIAISANGYLASSSLVDASSALSTPGTINLEARFTDVSSSLASLESNVLKGTDLLRGSCSTRAAHRGASSLVVTGREGLPPQPDGMLWSPLDLWPAQQSDSLSDEQETELFSQPVSLWYSANCTR
jgi:large exoprotein involved in heme utilization and adhesion